MKFESIHDLIIPKIGLGTWRIGGGTASDPSRDHASRTALRSALELGYTHLDTAEMYGAGHAEELIGSVAAEMKIERETLFITSKAMPSHLKHTQIKQACEASLRRLKMDYIDLYLIHWPQTGMDLSDTFWGLNQLVSEGKVRHLGVSNFNLKLLKRSREYSETPILTNQVPFSLSDQTYVENGVLEYCQQENILVTAYSPFDEGRLVTSRALDGIASRHQATPFQIVLAWIISHPRVITIPMSFDPQHQKENFEAAEIQLSEQEIQEVVIR